MQNAVIIDLMKIKIIEHKIAKPFIEKWHYSKKVPRGRNIFFGVYVEDVLYAVVNYGDGVNTHQSSFVSDLIQEDIFPEELLELKRLCRVEPRNDAVPLTKVLSICHKILRQRDYKIIIAFSDPAYGHTGGIYKAGNFLHVGQTREEVHYVDESGTIRHRRFPYKYAKSKGTTMKEAIKKLKLKPIKTPRKDRWLMRL